MIVAALWWGRYHAKLSLLCPKAPRLGSCFSSPATPHQRLTALMSCQAVAMDICICTHTTYRDAITCVQLGSMESMPWQAGFDLQTSCITA